MHIVKHKDYQVQTKSQWAVLVNANDKLIIQCFSFEIPFFQKVVQSANYMTKQ